MTPIGIQIAAGVGTFAFSLGALTRLWHSIDQDARKDREAKLVQARAYLKAQAAAMKPSDTRRGPLGKQHRDLTHAELALSIGTRTKVEHLDLVRMGQGRDHARYAR